MGKRRLTRDRTIVIDDPDLDYVIEIDVVLPRFDVVVQLEHALNRVEAALTSTPGEDEEAEGEEGAEGGTAQGPKKDPLVLAMVDISKYLVPYIEEVYSADRVEPDPDAVVDPEGEEAEREPLPLVLDDSDEDQMWGAMDDLTRAQAVFAYSKYFLFEVVPFFGEAAKPQRLGKLKPRRGRAAKTRRSRTSRRSTRRSKKAG